MKVINAAGKTVKWMLMLGALLIVVIIVIALVSLGNAGNKSEKSSKQVKPAAWANLKMGTPASQVKARFGKPERTDSTEAAGFKQTCWYYGILASSGSYQVCFNAKNRVSVKNRF